MSFKTFGWDSVLQRITSLQNRWGGTVKTTSWVADVSAHLSYPLDVGPRCNPRGFYGDRVASVGSAPDISKSTVGEDLI